MIQAIYPNVYSCFKKNHSTFTVIIFGLRFAFFHAYFWKKRTVSKEIISEWKSEKQWRTDQSS